MGCETGVSDAMQLGVTLWGVKQVLRCNTMGCDTVGCETGVLDAIQLSMIQWDVKQVLRCNTMWCDTVGCRTGFVVQNNWVQYSGQ